MSELAVAGNTDKLPSAAGSSAAGFPKSEGQDTDATACAQASASWREYDVFCSGIPSHTPTISSQEMGAGASPVERQRTT